MLKLSDLAPNPKNPRTITDSKLDLLKKALIEFGDLSGIIYNRETKQLVGGHQRVKLIPKNVDVHIEKRFSKPTKVGTVAEGFVEYNGERFKYREVSWDETKEKAANIAANKGAGEWDLVGLSEWMRDLDSFSFDLDLTLFDETERHDLMIPSLNPNFEPGTEAEQGKLDEKKPIECPHCGVSFVA